jgi:hypothetical protein
VRFRHEYAWLLAQLNQTDALLTPALSALESHPMRQRVGSGKTRAANQSSWYAPLGAACSARANDVVQQALTAHRRGGRRRGLRARDASGGAGGGSSFAAAARRLLLREHHATERDYAGAVRGVDRLRPHVPANQATFARIEEQLSRFKRAAFTAPLPPTPAHQQQPASAHSAARM